MSKVRLQGAQQPCIPENCDFHSMEFCVSQSVLLFLSFFLQLMTLSPACSVRDFNPTAGKARCQQGCKIGEKAKFTYIRTHLLSLPHLPILSPDIAMLLASYKPVLGSQS